MGEDLLLVRYPSACLRYVAERCCHSDRSLHLLPPQCRGSSMVVAIILLGCCGRRLLLPLLLLLLYANGYDRLPPVRLFLPIFLGRSLRTCAHARCRFFLRDVRICGLYLLAYQGGVS